MWVCDWSIQKYLENAKQGNPKAFEHALGVSNAARNLGHAVSPPAAARQSPGGDWSK